jgi:hypothetical protein
MFSTVVKLLPVTTSVRVVFVVLNVSGNVPLEGARVKPGVVAGVAIVRLWPLARPATVNRI